MKYKLITYKKSGTEKGNRDKEFLFSNSSDALRRFNELSTTTNYALNPTLWVKSGKEWIRYGEGDFQKFFLEKRKIDILSENVKCCDELVVNDDTIEAAYELWCDVDLYFGTNTKTVEDKCKWINFYTYWHPNGTITAKYFLEGDHICEENDWPLTEAEQDFFLSLMEQHASKTERMTLEEIYYSSVSD